ncbi:hypothetical protein STEG23_037348 [Scotinomys teguina]
MQPDQVTNNGGGTMEVVAAAPRCQLLLIMLMAAMLLLGMKGSPLLVQRTVTRTLELQESISKVMSAIVPALPLCYATGQSTALLAYSSSSS